MVPSTLASVARLIVQALDERELNGLGILSDAGLDAERLHDANARYRSPA